MKTATLTALIALFANSASAFTITFHNNCAFTVWPAIGKAPYGSPDPSVAYGTTLTSGNSVSYNIADSEIGIRAWGRTGCNASGASCATGGCVGGMVCTDAGINSGVIVSEYGFGDFGSCCGGDRIAWDISHVNLNINLGTQVVASDGPTALCTTSSCPSNQAYDTSTDYAADRNSALGTTFTHTFCP